MPQPPQKGHPLALALFKLLRDRPEADRRLVYRALVANSIYSAGEERSAVAMHGLETCAAETGGTPSRRAYDAWRASKPDPSEWASSSQIRGAFGSWPKALDALGLEPAEDTLARRLLSRAGRFTEVDCTTAIELCVDAVTNSDKSPIRRLTFREYKSWAHQHNAAAADHDEQQEQPEQQQQPVPVNVKTFHQLFGTWGDALAAAGHVELATPTAGVRYPGPGGPHDSYTETEILAALKQAGADQGERKLTMNAYRDWRAQKLDQAVDDGRVEHIPGLRVVATFYGSWAEALAAAGLITAEQQAYWRKQPLKEFTESEMVTSLIRAIEARGRVAPVDELLEQAKKSEEAAPHAGVPNPVLPRHAYKSWRLEQMRANSRARVPSDAVIIHRLSNWDRAVRIAVEAMAEGEGRMEGSDSDGKSGGES